MKKMLIVAAAMLLVPFATDSRAVDDNPGFGLEQELSDREDDSAPEQTVQAPQQTLVRSYAILGENLYGSEGEQLGKITQVLLDLDTGRIAYLQVSSNGFLRIGADERFVPWQVVKLDPEEARLSLDMSENQFEEAPAGDELNQKYLSSIYQFYGISPYWQDGDKENRQPEKPGTPNQQQERGWTGPDEQQAQPGGGTPSGPEEER